MKTFFTLFANHEVEEKSNVEAVDIITAKYDIRIRPTGILVTENNKVVLDQKLDLTEEKI